MAGTHDDEAQVWDSLKPIFCTSLLPAWKSEGTAWRSFKAVASHHQQEHDRDELVYVLHEEPARPRYRKGPRRGNYPAKLRSRWHVERRRNRGQTFAEMSEKRRQNKMGSSKHGNGADSALAYAILREKPREYFVPSHLSMDNLAPAHRVRTKISMYRSDEESRLELLDRVMREQGEKQYRSSQRMSEGYMDAIETHKCLIDADMFSSANRKLLLEARRFQNEQRRMAAQDRHRDIVNSQQMMLDQKLDVEEARQLRLRTERCQKSLFSAIIHASRAHSLSLKLDEGRMLRAQQIMYGAYAIKIQRKWRKKRRARHAAAFRNSLVLSKSPASRTLPALSLLAMHFSHLMYF